ncbi:hypothetical protein NR224_01020 [Pediococcus ethanolidurans]|uniref:hypothetical protein n=1 Tax=Pediococcus ethanolidurans TaxID=319653 RepID=UPI001C1EC699|nr:hypothetical protein [Pediococcus ethanolidurans]MCV3320801.1 hypothetical protein [Pediococcus ethanolidurans]
MTLKVNNDVLHKLITSNWSQLYIHYLMSSFKLSYVDANSHLALYVGKRLDSYQRLHSADDIAIYEAINNEDHLVLFEIITRGYMDARRNLAQSSKRDQEELAKAKQLTLLNRNTAKQLQIDPQALSEYLKLYVRNADTRKFIYDCLTNGVKWTQDEYELTDRQLAWKMRGIEKQFNTKNIKQTDVDNVINYQEHHTTQLISQLAMAIQFNNYDALHSIIKGNWDSDVCCDVLDVDEPIRMFKLLGLENIHSTYQMVDNINELMDKHHLNWEAIKL